MRQLATGQAWAFLERSRKRTLSEAGAGAWLGYPRPEVGERREAGGHTLWQVLQVGGWARGQCRGWGAEPWAWTGSVPGPGEPTSFPQ